MKSLEAGVDDAVHAFYVYDANHGRVRRRTSTKQHSITLVVRSFFRDFYLVARAAGPTSHFGRHYLPVKVLFFGSGFVPISGAFSRLLNIVVYKINRLRSV